MSDASKVSAASAEKLRDTYIELMKNVLSFALWEGRDGSIRPLKMPHKNPVVNKVKVLVRNTRIKLEELSGKPVDFEAREEGYDWPSLAHTMIGVKRLNNLQYCVEEVIKNGVPGDFIETGVWRGGASIFMRSILLAYGVTDRKVWVADSFEGLPEPDAEKYPADKGDLHHKQPALAISLEDVQANFQKYGLLDDQVCFLKGWFKDTLPTAPLNKLAIVRLDGDMYESTMDGFNALYSKLSPGGFLIVDDYGNIPACRQAVADFRQANGITEKIHVIDRCGVFWQRGAV